jgi:hypothetical protein
MLTLSLEEQITVYNADDIAENEDILSYVDLDDTDAFV